MAGESDGGRGQESARAGVQGQAQMRRLLRLTGRRGALVWRGTQAAAPPAAAPPRTRRRGRMGPRKKTRRGVSGRSCKGRQQTSSYPTRRSWSGEFHVLHLPHPLSSAACIARLLPPFDEPSSLTMYITWIVSPAAPPPCRPRASICHEAGCWLLAVQRAACVSSMYVCLHACMYSRSAPTANTNTSDLCPAALTPTCTTHGCRSERVKVPWCGWWR